MRTVSLKEYVLSLLREKDKRDNQRFKAQKEALSAAFQSAKEAVTKAEIAAEKRFELLNELRGGVATKEQFEALDKRMVQLEAWKELQTGKSQGMSLTAAVLVTTGTFILGLVSLYFAIRH